VCLCLQVPEEWFCGDCVIVQQLEQQRAVLANRRQTEDVDDDDVRRLRACATASDTSEQQQQQQQQQQPFSTPLTETDALRQLLLNAMTASVHEGDAWMSSSRHMHLARWCAEIQSSKNRSSSKQQSDAADSMLEHFISQVSFTSVYTYIDIPSLCIDQCLIRVACNESAAIDFIVISKVHTFMRLFASAVDSQTHMRYIHNNRTDNFRYVLLPTT
jgi:hypothetical protein